MKQTNTSMSIFPPWLTEEGNPPGGTDLEIIFVRMETTVPADRALLPAALDHCSGPLPTAFLPSLVSSTLGQPEQINNNQ